MVWPRLLQDSLEHLQWLANITLELWLSQNLQCLCDSRCSGPCHCHEFCWKSWFASTNPKSSSRWNNHCSLRCTASSGLTIEAQTNFDNKRIYWLPVLILVSGIGLDLATVGSGKFRSCLVNYLVIVLYLSRLNLRIRSDIWFFKLFNINLFHLSLKAKLK